MHSHVYRRKLKTEHVEFRESGESLLGKETAMRLGVLKIGANIASITDFKQTLKQQYPQWSGKTENKTG